MTRSSSTWSPRWRSAGSCRPPVRPVRLLGRRAVRQSLPAAARPRPSVGRLDRRARLGDASGRRARLVGRRARSRDRFGAALDLEALRRVPVQTLVGAADLDTDEITHREGGRYFMPGANEAGASRGRNVSRPSPVSWPGRSGRDPRGRRRRRARSLADHRARQALPRQSASAASAARIGRRMMLDLRKSVASLLFSAWPARRRNGERADPQSRDGLGREDRRSDLEQRLHPARLRLHGLGRAVRPRRQVRCQAADGRDLGRLARQAHLDLHAARQQVEQRPAGHGRGLHRLDQALGRAGFDGSAGCWPWSTASRPSTPGPSA